MAHYMSEVRRQRGQQYFLDGRDSLHELGLAGERQARREKLGDRHRKAYQSGYIAASMNTEVWCEKAPLDRLTFYKSPRMPKDKFSQWLACLGCARAFR